MIEPMVFAQAVVSAFIAILFLQSGLDKVMDFGGNLAWLEGHFAKSPLRGQVKPMLSVVTVLEIVAGALCAAGAVQVVLAGSTQLAGWGAQAASATITMLFFGQRVAKDYVGAAVLVPYFILCVGAVLLMAR
ncbi:MAG: hypothetical protein RI990_994 [Planctomycetota bacterium]|jgi:uncharacterized membrane protein YphA (DoxX/SURF4 family)